MLDWIVLFPVTLSEPNYLKPPHFVLYGQLFVKWFTLCYRTVVLFVCPVLSLAFVYCSQTAGWIRMPLGTEVGLGPGHIVLHRDPAPPTERSTAAPRLLQFTDAGCACINRSPCLLWSDGWMDQDATWYGADRLLHVTHCWINKYGALALTYFFFHFPVFNDGLLSVYYKILW